MQPLQQAATPPTTLAKEEEEEEVEEEAADAPEAMAALELPGDVEPIEAAATEAEETPPLPKYTAPASWVKK